ncbi:MAG TPA: cyclopropane-fatty-acyl-phospholipid synthase family protein [Bacteroidota bacterium]
MHTQEILSNRAGVQTGLSILRHIFSGYHPRDFAFRFWDGTVWGPEAGQVPQFTFVLRHAGALRKMFLHGDDLSLGEAYIYDDVDLEGDINAALAMAERLVGMRISMAEKAHIAGLLLLLPSDGKGRVGRQGVLLRGSLHSKERDRQAVTYHYNVSNEFFALWLDRLMVYSSAYFKSPVESLDAAQKRKLEYMCRKLRLRPGERMLDIGCGWGGLIMYAATRYHVDATGITLSEPQAQLANERIRRKGISGHCRAQVRDYRDLVETESFDRIVSVGMVEHVGESLLPEYFSTAWRLLRPGGVFLNHGIGAGPGYTQKEGPTFSDRYIFPDTELVPLSTTLRIAEASGFEVRDVENLREHYTLTLHAWQERLEKQHARALKFVDEATYRTWRLCHAGAARNFLRGRTSLFQCLFVKPAQGKSGLPLTRADWYQRG